MNGFRLQFKTFHTIFKRKKKQTKKTRFAYQSSKFHVFSISLYEITKYSV